MMKRAMGIMISFLMLISMLAVGAVSASAACAATVTVDTVSGAKGDVVEVAVSISDLSYLVNADMKLTYDPTKLAPDTTYYADPDGDEGDTLCYKANADLFKSGWMFIGNNTQEGTFCFVAAVASHNGMTEGGEMFRVAFRILDDDVSSAALTFSADPVMANDGTGELDEYGYPIDTVLELTVVNGGVEIEQPAPPALPGDINDDGVIDMVDAFAVYTAAATGNVSAAVLEKADMNGDGTIDMVDAFAVYRVASGAA